MTLYIIKDDNPKYEIIKRGRTTEPRNGYFFYFKHELSAKIPRRPEFFHATDNAIESDYVIKALKLDRSRYHTYYTFVNLNDLYAAIWTSFPHKKDTPPYNNKIIKLQDSPHYLYVCGQKSEYLKYAKNVFSII